MNKPSDPDKAHRTAARRTRCDFRRRLRISGLAILFLALLGGWLRSYWYWDIIELSRNTRIESAAGALAILHTPERPFPGWITADNKTQRNYLGIRHVTFEITSREPWLWPPVDGAR